MDTKTTSPTIKQTTIYVDHEDLRKFDKFADSYGESRVSLLRKLIKVFNSDPEEIMRKFLEL